ncbi:hypothetical protein LSTR_LSTR003653 [Laodelphax striatellus]|uniref:Uncharacterized protein n=1 Tax=Laodelphax striatellus TaxID=195883 RepID=A0A482XAX0_LAOST|nr:hypothetical protein LSTR_LSTR003653 [Laodelphax striatellus]
MSENESETEADIDMAIATTPISGLPYTYPNNSQNTLGEVVRFSGQGTKPRSLGQSYFYYG